MKMLKLNNKRILAFVFGIFALGFFSSQNLSDWDKLDQEQRKELIKNMTPEQRQKVFAALRDNAVVSDLDIPKEKEQEFKNIFNEYQNSQRDIKMKFVPREDYEKMSSEEANKQLNKSFEVGQQLLDNRKKYAEKMQQLIPPQQVLKMFNNEGRMRGKMMDKDAGQMMNAPRPPRQDSAPRIPSTGGRRP